jgi:hypothetical protein
MQVVIPKQVSSSSVNDLLGALFSLLWLPGQDR